MVTSSADCCRLSNTLRNSIQIVRSQGEDITGGRMAILAVDNRMSILAMFIKFVLDTNYFGLIY